MADFSAAFNYVMDREDRNRTGKVTKDPTKEEPDAVARFGVNSAAHPELVERKYFEVIDGVPTMSNDDALAEAADVFKYDYFMHLSGYTLADQDVVNKFCDFAFNEGISEATKIIQRAVNEINPDRLPPLTVDGLPGARTIAAINACEPERLLPAMKEQAIAFYRALAVDHPQFVGDLDAWITRVNS